MNFEERPFVIDGSGSLTYGELRERVAKRASSSEPWCAERSAAEIFVRVVCAMAANQPLLLIDPQLTEEERARLGLSRGTMPASASAGAAAIFSDVPALIAQCRASDRFTLGLLTSGSTGLPKRVDHTLGGLTRSLRVGERHADDVWALCYNPAHMAGVQVFLQAFCNGNPLVNLFQSSPRDAWRGLHEHRVTHLSATPTFYRMLVSETEFRSEQVRAVTLGGEASDAALIERLAAVFPRARIRNLYASTEAGTLLVSRGDIFEIPAAMQPVIRIEQGTLRLHRSLLGHFADEAAGAAEWYDTGDKVELVAGGGSQFRFAGRERDWINIGGEKINPAEIEAELAKCDGVIEARVHARRNSVVGWILGADIVARGEPDERALRDFLAARLHPLKVPRVFNFVPRLEHTRTGKLLRS